MRNKNQRKVTSQLFQSSTNVQRLNLINTPKTQYKPSYYINILQRYPFTKIQSQTYFQVKLQKCIYGKRQQIQHKFLNHKLFNTNKQKEEKVQIYQRRNNLNLVTTYLTQNYSKSKIQNLDKIIQAFEKIRAHNIIKFNVQSQDKQKSDRQNISIILNYQVVKKSMKKYVMNLPTQRHVQIFLKKAYSDIKQLALQLLVNQIEFALPTIENIGVQIENSNFKNHSNKEKLNQFLSQQIGDSNPQLYPYQSIKAYIDLSTCKYLKSSDKKYFSILSNIDEKVQKQCWNKMMQLLGQYKQRFPQRCQFSIPKNKPNKNQSALLQALEQRKSKNQIRGKRSETPHKYYLVNAIMEEKQEQQQLSLQNHINENLQKSLKKKQILQLKTQHQNQKKIIKNQSHINTIKIIKQQQHIKQNDEYPENISSTENSEHKKSSTIQFSRNAKLRSIPIQKSRIFKQRQSQPISPNKKKQFIDQLNEFYIQKRNSMMNVSCYDQLCQKNNTSNDLLNDSNLSVFSNKSTQIKDRVNNLLQKSMKTLDSFRQKYSISKEKSSKKQVLKTHYDSKELKALHLKYFRDNTSISLIEKQTNKKQIINRYSKA